MLLFVILSLFVILIGTAYELLYYEFGISRTTAVERSGIYLNRKTGVCYVAAKPKNTAMIFLAENKLSIF